jgi:hypothetical protein
MENKGLLFIPDISGFTRFVTETEIEHSKMIIQELLEVLIDSNEIGLEISEVEGDAILFYRFGEPPALADIYRQVEKMFCAFHRNIIAYDHRRYCLCKACNAANSLTLKIVTHYGEFSGYNVQRFHKLIGKDIIVAHQLLKNDIETHEYWLVTDKLLPEPSSAEIKEWMTWKSSAKQTETGNIPFHFTHLAPLRKLVHVDPLPKLDLAGKIKVLTVSREYHTDFITLFHAAGDFAYRHEWMVGVTKVDMVDHYLPRVGMRCKATLENGDAFIYSSSYSYSDDRLEFSETNQTDKTLMYFTIDILEPKKTRLTVDYYVNKGLSGLVFAFTKKKKLEQRFEQSLTNLERFASTLVIPL